jgi:hypothetical protein
MIKKSVFEEELISGMQQELRAQSSQSSVGQVNQAVSYLQSAMEILEQAGMQSKANAIRGLLTKIANKNQPVKQLPAMHLLMKAGLTQKDIYEFAKGNLMAKAKVEYILSDLGYANQQAAFESLLKSEAQKTSKFQTPSTSKLNDPHIKGLTPEKQIENLKHHGTVFNMKDEGAPTKKAPAHKADDDFLDADVVSDELEVSDADSNLEMDFEDEI